jgi:ribosomal protein L40E
VKARLIVVDFDGVTSSDLTTLMDRAFGTAATIQLAAPLAPAQEAPAMPEPVASQPEHTRMQLAPLPHEWRPRAKRSSGNAGVPARTERSDAESSRSLRPRTAAKSICAGCGADKPPGPGRFKCTKCGSFAWEKCGAKEELAGAVGGE